MGARWFQCREAEDPPTDLPIGEEETEIVAPVEPPAGDVLEGQARVALPESHLTGNRERTAHACAVAKLIEDLCGFGQFVTGYVVALDPSLEQSQVGSGDASVCRGLPIAGHVGSFDGLKRLDGPTFGVPEVEEARV